MITSTLFFGYFASRIEFNEDLTSLLPASENGSDADIVFSNLKVKDKVFILFRTENDSVDTDQLADVCDSFVERILEKDSTDGIINNMLYRIEEEWLETAMGFLYENAPLFIDTTQYAAIDSMLTPEYLNNRMASNREMLLSAAGGMMQEMIVRDPLALREVMIQSLGSLKGGLGGNFMLYGQHFFTSDTTVAIAFLTPNVRSFDTQLGTKLHNLILQTAQEIEQEYPGIEVLHHGAPIQGVYNSKRIKADLVMTVAISLFIIAILLLICFRNKTTLLYLVLPVGYGVIMAMAILYLVQGTISLMAMGIGAIVMGVAFSYCLHVLTHFKYVNDPIEVLRGQTVPVILGALTTIGAFLGLMLTSSALLQDFGLFASLGMAGTTIFALIFLPQMFNTNTNRRSERAFAFLDKINNFPFERQYWLIVLLLVVAGICYWKSDDVKFDSDLRNIGFHHPDIVKSQQTLLSKSSGGYNTVYFASVSSDIDEAVSYADSLCAALDPFIAAGKVQSYSPTYNLLTTQKEQEDRIAAWQNFWNEDRQATIRKQIEKAATNNGFDADAFTPFYDMIEADYEPFSIYDAEVIPTALMENLVEKMNDLYLVFVPVRMDRQYLIEVGDQVVRNDDRLIVIDTMYYTDEMVRNLHTDFSTTLTVSSLFVLLVLLISYKSLTLAFLAFLPMGLSWYIVLGIMAMTGMEFNLINIVISTFIFGVGVDYSIFIMDGNLSTYRTKSSLLTYHKSAIFFSAVILLIVVASLLFAVHPAIYSIGTTTIIGMASTILIAYTLQPFLFNLIIAGRAKCKKAPLSFSSLFIKGDKTSAEYLLKSNYFYKGFDVVHSLRNQWRRTNGYAALSDIKEQNQALVYGASYGFIAYFLLFSQKAKQITAYEADAERRAIAEYAFRKTDALQLTDDSTNLPNADLLVIEQADCPQHLIAAAKYILIAVNSLSLYTQTLSQSGFQEHARDNDYILFEKA